MRALPSRSNKYRSSTLVGVRHLEMVLQAAFRTGRSLKHATIEEKYRARAVVWILANEWDSIEDVSLMSYNIYIYNYVA